MARERSKEINERKRHARWVNRRERFVMTTYKKMQEFDILQITAKEECVTWSTQTADAGKIGSMTRQGLRIDQIDGI